MCCFKAANSVNDPVRNLEGSLDCNPQESTVAANTEKKSIRKRKSMKKYMKKNAESSKNYSFLFLALEARAYISIRARFCISVLLLQNSV